MTVKEVQALVPKSEVYELRGDCKYVIVLPRGTPSGSIIQMFETLKAIGLTNIAAWQKFSSEDTPQFYAFE